jgi:hypothetical protein
MNIRIKSANKGEQLVPIEMPTDCGKPGLQILHRYYLQESQLEAYPCVLQSTCMGYQSGISQNIMFLPNHEKFVSRVSVLFKKQLSIIWGKKLDFN